MENTEIAVDCVKTSETTENAAEVTSELCESSIRSTNNDKVSDSVASAKEISENVDTQLESGSTNDALNSATTSANLKPEGEVTVVPQDAETYAEGNAIEGNSTLKEDEKDTHETVSDVISSNAEVSMTEITSNSVPENNTDLETIRNEESMGFSNEAGPTSKDDEKDRQGKTDEVASKLTTTVVEDRTTEITSDSVTETIGLNTIVDEAKGEESMDHLDEEGATLKEGQQLVEKTKQNESNSPPTGATSSLGLLMQYASSSSDDDDDDDEGSSSEDDKESSSSDSENNATKVSTNCGAEAKELFDKVLSSGTYRVVVSDTESDESDESDVEYLGTLKNETVDITEDDDFNSFMESCGEQPQGPMKVKGEFGIEDLPPIEELTITVPESECIQLGTVSGIVETLVLVESLPNFAAVDINTVLFLDKGNRTLGQVFDVMGNVSSPIYCVRFNKKQDIVDKNISVGLVVYVAPRSEHTNFIVMSELMKQKGTDASWEYDIEPPDGCVDYSDDEEERLARRAHNQRQRNRNRTSISSDADMHLPNKVQIKSEPSDQNSQRRGGRPKRRTGGPQRGQNPMQFYKENHGYANAAPPYANYYQGHPQQQPSYYDHSWHTATLRGTLQHPPPPPPPPLMHQSTGFPSQQIYRQGFYPNPFAAPTSPSAAYDPSNLQAFPPLPPPMSSPTSNQSHFHARNRQQGHFNKRQGSSAPKF